jgi:polyhydroxyalkanoate synthesis repressor PhaR
MPSNRRAAETAPGHTDGPRVLKKYPNRRLYDTQTSSYITLTDVKQMVLDAEVFEVRDAKSGEELTRSILLQIILEEESAGMPMFSTQMLAQLIRFYGHTMQGMMGEYMERNLQGFVDLQSRFADQTGGLYEGKAFNPEAWAQFMAVQPPAMQNMMSSVFDQSKTLFTQMQLMQKQAESFFPGMAGFTPPPAKP